MTDWMLRVPPDPAITLIVPPGALTRVPLVIMSVDGLPLPLMEVSSIRPLFVKPDATVRLAELKLASPWTRKVDAAPVTMEPLIEGPLPRTTSVPRLTSGASILLEEVKVRVPALVTVPAPTIEETL